MKTLLIFLAVLGLTSCAALFEKRTFIDEMDRRSDPMFVAGRDFRVVPGDRGNGARSRDEILKRTPASAYNKMLTKEEASLEKELRDKEMKLQPIDFQEYAENKEYLPTTSEKLYYLGLSKDERREYIQTRTRYDSGLKKTLSYLETRTIRGREIYLGMDKNAVIRSWGRPNRVDIAGKPSHENERWSFYENGKLKQIYFENGQVRGWSQD